MTPVEARTGLSKCMKLKVGFGLHNLLFKELGWALCVCVRERNR